MNQAAPSSARIRSGNEIFRLDSLTGTRRTFKSTNYSDHRDKNWGVVPKGEVLELMIRSVRTPEESVVRSRITIAKRERDVHRIQVRGIQRREMQLLHLDGHEKSIHFHHSPGPDRYGSK
jgi:hypothetical protein